ncbi:6-phosphogluconolactonase [Arthrobacter pascens]|uniref:lactonase family protein n=1 Tax=Arthrobacter pascens TaxID=1677 RepID=UPI00278EE2E2|nr:beta-propeller fold lactonase family protein [Arthrobacter pascens]MDQ0678338.1 6-phosphogluconolactonase [Arthrobacter pascens]
MTRFAVYVACYEGLKIEVLLFDATSGTLVPLSQFSTAAPVHCLAMHPAKEKLYASLATDPPSVASLHISARGSLQHSATASSTARLAYLAVDPTGRFLLGASYEGNFISVARIDDKGNVPDAPLNSKSPGRHAHAVLPSPDGRFVYATSLGDDQIVWWLLHDEGHLVRQGSLPCPPNSGPRHLRFSPDGGVLYALHELSGAMRSYARDEVTGALAEINDASTIAPELGLIPGTIRNGTGPAPGANAIWSAELQVNPDGRFLYATERTSSTIAVLAHDIPTQSLTLRATVKTEEQPRGMAIDPTGKFLLVCGEISNRISIYRINRASGLLTWESSLGCSAGPRWIEFSPYQEGSNYPESRARKVPLPT